MYTTGIKHFFHNTAAVYIPNFNLI